MKKRRNPKLIDKENPEWTDAEFERAVALSALPKGIRKAVSDRKRGPQKTPTKQLVSLRLSPEVLSHFKAKGSGWQTRIDNTLKMAIHKVG
jgi:uncharacterized protein (DUF4415 family)